MKNNSFKELNSGIDRSKWNLYLHVPTLFSFQGATRKLLFLSLTSEEEKKIHTLLRRFVYGPSSVIKPFEQKTL
jgi:hypothetical protein